MCRLLCRGRAWRASVFEPSFPFPRARRIARVHTISPNLLRRGEVLLFMAEPRSVPPKYSATSHFRPEPLFPLYLLPIPPTVFFTTICTFLTQDTESTKHGANMYLGAGSTTTYVLPAPPGYWVPAIICDRTQPCAWRENPGLLGKRVYTLPLGSHDLDYPFACGIGLLGGNGSLAGEQTSATCAGFCPAGFVCSAQATVAPTPCPIGYFCPEGTSVARPCLPGSYSVFTNLTSASECTETNMGHYAPAGSTQQTKCSRGTVQPDAGKGTCDQCVVGSYQKGEGGSECAVCGAGNYSANALSCEPCQVGEYCPAGSVTGRMCPLGSTTEGRGAESLYDCGCPAGTFHTASGDEISCEPCDDDHMLCARTGLTLATAPLPPSRWRLSVTDHHTQTFSDPLICKPADTFLCVCSARTAPTTSRHATHPATCPLALAASTAPSAPTGTRGRAARRAPFPIATTTPLLQPAKSAATWSTMLSSSSPCFWSSSSFSLCCGLPASASRACSPGSQAGWHSFWPPCNTLGFRPSGSATVKPLHIPLRTTEDTFELVRHRMHRFKLLLSFGQVWLVRESVYGLYATGAQTASTAGLVLCYTHAPEPWPLPR